MHFISAHIKNKIIYKDNLYSEIVTSKIIKYNGKFYKNLHRDLPDWKNYVRISGYRLREKKAVDILKKERSDLIIQRDRIKEIT